MRLADVKSGQQFGTWTVLSDFEDDLKGRRRFLCRCACGLEKPVLGYSLTCNQSIMCQGCASRRGADKTRKHGSPWGYKLYGVYQGMRARCYRKSCKSYHNYGGRGIEICDEWLQDFWAFEKWALANGYRGGLTIDRKDNDGNYEPDNCHWITRPENTVKSRRQVYVTAFGETKMVIDWMRDPRCSVSNHTLSDRLKHNWSIEKAITLPAYATGRGRHGVHPPM